MAVKRISDLTAAAALDGEELIEVSQLSATVTITAATLSALASDNSFNDSANGFVAAGFAVGNRVRVQGFTGNVVNNLLVGVVTALTTGKMTIGGADGNVIVDDAAGESVTISKWESHRTTAQDIADLGGGGGGTEVLIVLVTDPNGSAITTGDGKAYFPIPSTIGGKNLTGVLGRLTTTSSSGIPTFQIHNLTQAADMLTTKLTIDAGELTSATAAAAAVIDGANDDVATGDILRVDCDVAGTGAKGFMLICEFS